MRHLSPAWSILKLIRKLFFKENIASKARDTMNMNYAVIEVVFMFSTVLGIFDHFALL